MAGTKKPGPQCSFDDWGDIDEGTMCRAQSPAPSPLGHGPSPDRWAGYEFGGIRQAVRGSTNVAMLDVKYRIGRSMPSGKNLSDDLLSWFAKKLSALDQALQGNARQSWGMIIYGEGTGEDSTATKGSQGAKLWSSSVDFSEFMAIMGDILVAIPEGTSYRASVEHMRDALNAKDPEKAATFIKETAYKMEEIKKFLAVKEAHDPAKPTKIEVGQWVAYDRSGNLYIMIKYTDGSRRYVFGSMYGQKDIPNPGPMNWRQVPSA